jgi:hypothetical protein
VDLRHLESQQESQRLTIPPQTLQAVLTGMRRTLRRPDIIAKRGLLKKIPIRVEPGKDRGKVVYTFPLHELDQYPAPPGELLVKVRTLEYAVG